MTGHKIIKNAVAIIAFIFALTGMYRYVQAEPFDETSVAIFLDETGTVQEYCTYSNGSEVVPPTESVSFGWAEDTYLGRTGYYVVPPSVTDPQFNKVYTGILINNVFMPVKAADIENFSGRDDGSTYYYQGIPEAAFSLDWNGMSVDLEDETADWLVGADPSALSESPETLYDDVKERYKAGYYTPSPAGVTYLAPTAEKCRFYTVTFIWPDGIETQVVRSGGKAVPPSLNGQYADWEWSTSVYQSVQGELYISLYDPNEETRSVTWKDYDGSVLAECAVPHNAVPVYPGTVPRRETDENYNYYFREWEKIVDSGSSVVFQAIYSSVPRWLVTVKYMSYPGAQLAVQSGYFLNNDTYSLVPPHINGYRTPETVTGVINGSNVYKTINCAEKLFYGKQGYLLDDQFVELSDVIVKFNTGTYCVYNVGRNGTNELNVTYNDGTGDKNLDLKHPSYGSSNGYADMWLYGTSPDDISTPFLYAMGDGNEYLYMRYVGLRPSTTISDLEPLYVAYAQKLYTVTFVYPDTMGEIDPLVLTAVEGGEVTPPELPDIYDWDSEEYKNVTGTLVINARQICEGHEPVADETVAPSCEESGLTEGVHCGLCGRVLTPQEEIPPTGHSEAEDEEIAPTCLESGLSRGSHCSVCGKTLEKQEEIPALGHNWKQAEYVWSDDMSSVTAEIICSRDASHKEIETALTTSEIVSQPSWDRMGTTEYTAVFTNHLFETQTTTVDNVPVIPLEGDPWGTCSWVLYDGILTISEGKGEDTGGVSPWNDYKEYISEINFEQGIELPVDCSGLFKNFTRLESIDFAGTETENTVNFQDMFRGCKLLESLSLDSFNTGRAENMDDMFEGCEALASVNLGDGFSFLGNGDDIKTALPQERIWEDQNGERLSALQTAKRNQPGQYTGIRPAAYWGTCPLELVDGVMTVYAGNGAERSSHTYSTGNNSWMTVYYYPWSSDIMKDVVQQLVFTEGVHFPANSEYLISRMSVIESVTLEEGVDTSDVESFSYAFSGAGASLKKIDLTGATSESLLDTSDMFHGAIDCGVEEIILGTGFTCEHVTDMEYMFTYLPELKNLDLTFFNPSSAVKTSSFIKKCDSLEELDLSGKDFSNANTLSGWFSSMTGMKRLNLSDAEFPSTLSWYSLSEAQNLELVIVGKNSSLPLSFYQSLSVQKVNGSTQWFSLDSQAYESGDNLRSAAINGNSGVLIKCSIEVNGTDSVFDHQAHTVTSALQAPEGFYLEFRDELTDEWSLTPPSYIDACSDDKSYQIYARIRCDDYEPEEKWTTFEQYIRPLDISDPYIQINNGNEFISPGCRIEPLWDIVFGDYQLELEVDYEIVEQGENASPGAGYVKIRGMKNYTGEKTIQFTIRSLQDLNTLKTPESIQIIEDETFYKTSAQAVILSPNCTKIGRRSFADCDNLIVVQIPESVTTIAPDTFEGTNVTIYAPKSSYAVDFAKTKKLHCVQYED